MEEARTMSLLERWLDHGPLLTDGAWGTELQKRGLAPGDSADAWNLDHPPRVASVAQSYVDAGSRVILTNTFRANSIALRSAGLADRAGAINRAGVEISRAAAAGKALVFASIGPSGKILVSGEVSEEDLESAFVVQAEALARAAPDALVLETFSDIEEARIAVRAALRTGLPVIASFAFDSGRNRDRTMMGATPEQVAEAMTREGVAAVGANCGNGIDQFVPVCRRLHAACDLPVWIKPNAGLPEFVAGEIRYAQTPSEFAAQAPALLEAGALFLGGCCGAGPEFISALRAHLPTCA
jgi:5-methyltetrahydrofolate--homocysteine methyltransferase